MLTAHGRDSALFSIDWGTGQIMTKGPLDHETKETYTVVVRATDPTGIPGASTAVRTNSGTVTVNITVTDVNEAPDGDGRRRGDLRRDDGQHRHRAGHVYTADDPDDGAPPSTWSVDGADGSKFTAAGGELKFKKKPDYENPTDANKDNVYEVTVQASDGKKTGMIKVMVSVTNAERSRGGDPVQGAAGGRHPGEGHADRPRRQHIQAHLAVVERQHRHPRRQLGHLHAGCRRRGRHPDGDGELLRRTERR